MRFDAFRLTHLRNIYVLILKLGYKVIKVEETKDNTYNVYLVKHHSRKLLTLEPLVIDYSPCE